MPAALWCQSLCCLWLRGRYVPKLNTRVMKDLWFPKIPSETESRDFFKIFGHAILVLHYLFAQTSATLLALPRHSLADSRRLRSTGSAPCPITPAVTAENLFLRKQLALFRERQVKPHRATDATRWIMATLRLLSRGAGARQDSHQQGTRQNTNGPFLSFLRTFDRLPEPPPVDRLPAMTPLAPASLHSRNTQQLMEGFLSNAIFEATKCLFSLFMNPRKYNIPVPALIIFVNAHSQGTWVENSTDTSVRADANDFVFLSNPADVLREMRDFLADVN